MKIKNWIKAKVERQSGAKASAGTAARSVHALHDTPGARLSDSERKKQRMLNQKKLEKIKKEQAQNAKKLELEAKRKAKKKAKISNADLSDQLLPKVIVGAIAMLVLVVASQFVSWTTGMLSQPVEVVEVKGEFEYLDKKIVSDIVNEALSEGYLKMDLPELHQHLAQVPWIETVYLRRKMNNALQIEIVERQPLAYWNNENLLSDKAVEFRPKALPENLLLPRLSGLDLQQTLELYQGISERMPQEFLPLMSFHLDYDGSIELATVNGLVVVLDEESLDEQIERFNLVTQHALAKKLADVEKIDVRYSNGAAVSWKERAVVSIGH